MQIVASPMLLVLLIKFRFYLVMLIGQIKGDGFDNFRKRGLGVEEVGLDV